MKKGKKLFNIIFITISIGLSAYFIPWGIIGMWLGPVSGDAQKELDRGIRHGFDGAILYIDGPDGTQVYASGYNNREDETLADPEDLFKIASISKLYIAAAAVKMVEEGRFSLDDRLSELLPDLAEDIENADRITLRMLISHRSGIPDFLDQSDYPWESLPKDNAQTMKYFLGRPAEFEPDKKYDYSNSNYLLLGEIMDKYLGYSHHQYITEEILMPLGLTDTYHMQEEVDMDRVMSGYFVGYEPDIKNNNYTSPGGSMIASVSDVGVFLRALNTGTLLNQQEQSTYSQVYDYGHTGLLPGYQSIARYYKDSDTVVILLMNTSGDDRWSRMEILYKRILKILEV